MGPIFVNNQQKHTRLVAECMHAFYSQKLHIPPLLVSVPAILPLIISLNLHIPRLLVSVPAPPLLLSVPFCSGEKYKVKHMIPRYSMNVRFGFGFAHGVAAQKTK